MTGKLGYLIPKFSLCRWGGDGLHEGLKGLTYCDGWNLAVAWLGLHIEISIATERRP